MCDNALRFLSQQIQQIYKSMYIHAIAIDIFYTVHVTYHISTNACSAVMLITVNLTYRSP